MRKAIAIVCLTAFFALQYGKLVSYWHCKVSAAIATAICDCEKMVVDFHKAGADHSDAAAIAKEKTEETYLFHDIIFINISFPVFKSKNFPAYITFIPGNYSCSIFQPPRV